jgi:hypothetical protein
VLGFTLVPPIRLASQLTATVADVVVLPCAINFAHPWAGALIDQEDMLTDACGHIPANNRIGQRRPRFARQVGGNPSKRSIYALQPAARHAWKGLGYRSKPN